MCRGTVVGYLEAENVRRCTCKRSESRGGVVAWVFLHHTNGGCPGLSALDPSPRATESHDVGLHNGVDMAAINGE